MASWEIINADVMDGLRQLADESVQIVVTSPAYWGLRDYGTAKWEGGNPECDHAHFLGGHGVTSAKQVTSAGTQKYQYRTACSRCGAVRIDNQLGLEPNPDCLGWATRQPCGECYVCHLVAVFREVRRVLRDDGTVFMNMGDSYAGSGKGAWDRTDIQKEVYVPKPGGAEASIPKVPAGLKPKDLCMIPARVALALQADGWWLRSDIIWAKPNPMPESVTDRPTKAHEYIFLLTKSARYYYDADAVREESSLSSQERTKYNNGNPSPKNLQGVVEGVWCGPMSMAKAYGQGRNLRTVWEIATQAFSSAHFATFPPALVERCIKAGSKEGDLVLDPFSGAGTTALVAVRLGRRAIGIDLNAAYCDMARDRIIKDRGLDSPEQYNGSPAQLRLFGS